MLRAARMNGIGEIDAQVRIGKRPGESGHIPEQERDHHEPEGKEQDADEPLLGHRRFRRGRNGMGGVRHAIHRSSPRIGTARFMVWAPHTLGTEQNRSNYSITIPKNRTGKSACATHFDAVAAGPLPASFFPSQPCCLANTTTRIAKIKAIIKHTLNIRIPSMLPNRPRVSPPTIPSRESSNMTAHITSNSSGFSFPFIASRS